jgi:hypothetical protein
LKHKKGTADQRAFFIWWCGGSIYYRFLEANVMIAVVVLVALYSYIFHVGLFPAFFYLLF